MTWLLARHVAETRNSMEKHCPCHTKNPQKRGDIEQARPGVSGIRYLGPFYFRYIVFYGQNSGIKYLVFPEF